MKKWKDKKFRPAIIDENFSLRRRYHRAWKKSDMTKEAFNRKFAEAGIEIMEQVFVNHLAGEQSRQETGAVK